MQQINFSVDIGFAIFNDGVELIWFADGSTQDHIKVTRVLEPDAPFQVLPFADCFFDYEQQQEKFESAIDFLRNRANTLREILGKANQERRAQSVQGNCLPDALQVLSTLVGPRGAKVFVFNHNVVRQGKFALETSTDSAPKVASAQTASKEDDSTLFKCYVL
jgi:hypothetical protein